ncbi:MAG TPA: carboxylating nicotinate-nucleotide diphosphorylase [Bdellovibrionales bacterium]|nr:carboxylating nicotinate-nucleotide diphosphorylase [Bdellovibrionales bacterium]
MTLNEMIRQSYAEDIPGADITTDNLGIKNVIGDAKLVAKEDMVLAGRAAFEACVKYIDPDMRLNWQFKDGDFVLNKQVICWLRGDLLKLLKAERVALNFLGRLSGIATLTRCFVQEVHGTRCKILDTRKTTPLWRALEKEAVRAGGGQNHRMHLSAAILIKENHIRAAGGVSKAIAAIRKNTSEPVEIECLSMDDVDQAVKSGVNRILLDNMTTEQTRAAKARIPASISVEASGNMRLERVREVAETGVDYISVGALTHSAPSADVSLLFEWNGVNAP